MRRAAQLAAPPPDLTVSQWADENRRLSSEASAEPGRWKTSRAPYQREILDAVNDASCEMVVVMSSAQVGKTELLLNTIGYFADYDPAPILLLQPTLEMAQAFSKDRLAPMVRDTPALKNKIADSKARDSGNTILHKSFPGGHITMAGANSPASLASRPIRILLADEVDRFPVSAGTEGDPFNLAKKRTTTFWNKKILAVSTPTVKGASRIEQLYADSSQEQYQLPCPECRHYQPLTWAQIDFETAHHACNQCGVLSDQHKWLSGIGLWSSQQDHPTCRGFHLNELVSPWRQWSQIIADFKEAKKTPDTLKVWVNTSLGETWEEEGDGVEHHVLYQRREHYAADVPEGAVVLTCAVDVQDDRFEIEVQGWGEGEENWRIDLQILRGDPARPEIWKQLADFLETKYKHESGTLMNISCTAIDSGGHFTQEVYKFVRPREGRRVYAIKGKAGAGMPIVGRPSRSNLGKVQLFSVGTDTAKEIVLARLKGSEPGPGYIHFPINNHFDEEYFMQLTAEQCMTSFVNGRPVRKWKKTRARNEAFDLAVYNTAALYILNPNFQALARRLQPEEPEHAPEPTAIQKINEERQKAHRPRRKARGFANSWR